MQQIRVQDLNHPIISHPVRGHLLFAGDTVPSDGTAGYAPGCLFLHVDGGNNSAIYVNEGTKASADFNLVAVDAPVDFSGLTASIAQLNTLASPTLTTGAGTGITAGTGTVYKNSVRTIGGIITTRILIDLTGLNSQATDGDIIGETPGAGPAHLGQITAAQNGTILGGVMRCLEVPAGGDPNIALYSATEATGKYDDAITGLTETTLFDPNADWTIDMDRSLTAVPAADEYLYLVQGDATGTAATYTAGKFLIELYGY